MAPVALSPGTGREVVRDGRILACSWRTASLRQARVAETLTIEHWEAAVAGLRPTHLGYAYQDLLTAMRLVDVAIGRTASVIVDTKVFAGDRFDDLTSEGPSGRERLQIKHTAHDRPLSAKNFTGDSRGLRLDLLFASLDTDLQAHPATSYRLVVRDTEPQDQALVQVLRPVEEYSDPGPALHGLGGRRLRFDAALLRVTDPWKPMLAAVEDGVLERVCDALFVDVGVAACSLAIYAPGPAEAALLRRISEELGAGRPPNRHRAPEDVALALIEAATAARSLNGKVTSRDLLPRLGLEVDFGAVAAGYPVDDAVAVPRSGTLEGVRAAVTGIVGDGGLVVVTGEPGIGKSWLCEQLTDALTTPWIALRHHCWLGSTDTDRDRRVLTDVVIGSLLRQLEATVPEAVAQIRPRFAATAETLSAAVTAVRGLYPDRPIALIVDGIDHVSRVLGHRVGSAFEEPVDPASGLVTELARVQLPPGAVLVLASQPGDHLAAAEAAGAVCVTVPPLGHTEVWALAERLGVLAEEGPVTAGHGRMGAAVALIEERSRGNALYATYLCRQAVGPAPGLGPQEVGDAIERLGAVPSSADDLDGYYDYLVRGLTEGQRAAVSLLAVCDFAVSPDELREIFPLAGPLLGQALSNVAPVIVQMPGLGGLRIHHESFSRFVLRTQPDEWVDAIRAQAAQWLSQRGFFTDARAFRHLPELLSALGRDGELAELVGADFLARAVAGLQPPAAINHTLTVTARRAAARTDWALLVRCVELSRACVTYTEQGMSDSLVAYADVLVALLGGERTAASLLYEGRTTMAARWGLQLCAAVDRAGCAAPWEAYLSAWEREDDSARVHYGADSDTALFLAQLRGQIRVPGGVSPDPEGEEGSPAPAHRVARFLDQESLPAPGQVLDVLLECLSPTTLLDSVRLITRPERRAALLLHLAEARPGTGGDLPSTRTLAIAAWASGPCEPQQLLRHGVDAVELAQEVLGDDLDATLVRATQEVLDNHSAVSADPVIRWLGLLAVGYAVDRQAPSRLLPHLAGEGFYRAWLRFTVVMTGLRGDAASQKISEVSASAAARVALEELAVHADPFAGRPRACDLWPIHRLVREVLHDAVAVLRGEDLAAGITALQRVSRKTTTSLMGMAGNGPLITTELLSLLADSVGGAAEEVVHQLVRQMRDGENERGGLYPEAADFELEMARVSLVRGDTEEASRCWERAASYMAAYGSHKDSTIDELLEPLPDLFRADPDEARIRLARVQPLAYLVAHHTDGRGTSRIMQDWWRELTRQDPQGAARSGAEVLLTEPGLPDSRVDAARLELLTVQAAAADPVVLAVLRVTAGPDGQNVPRDITLLNRLSQVPSDDLARTQNLLPVLANSITATYDDQPFTGSSDSTGHGPTAALCAAARRCGAEGGPPRLATPARSRGASPSRDWSGPRGRYPTHSYLLAQQRPLLASGPAGMLEALRDYGSKDYDSPPGVRWSKEALANAVGWRLLSVAQTEGAEAASRLLHRISGEMDLLGPREVLADIAAGLALRQDAVPGGLAELAATAGMLAFTRIRGGGGWRSFAGRDHVNLWEQAQALDEDAAGRYLAARVADAVRAGSYSDTIGVSQALVSAFSVSSPDSSHPAGFDAFACWDAAFAVIEHRLPGNPALGAAAYWPTAGPVDQADVDAALARLAVATVALPERSDKRRALVAVSVLLACRPALAHRALAHVLSFDLGAGPITWLLRVLHDHMTGPLENVLVDRLMFLCRSDLLSVRAEASMVLVRAGHQPTAPAVTAAPAALARAVARSLDREDRP